jgi:hypothetical protein
MMPEELLGRYNHPDYITNLERNFIGNPTIIILPIGDNSRAKDLINNQNNYLFGKVDYKAIVNFKCGKCDTDIAPSYRPGQIPLYTCNNCRKAF